MTAPVVTLQEEGETLTTIPADASKKNMWLGGEPKLLDIEIEEKGVEDILAALTEEEREEMKDTTMPIRYFRAEKGKTSKAIEKLRSSLQWRKHFRVDDIVNCMKEGGDEEIRKGIIEEHDTGILYVRGYDAKGRAIVCANPVVPKTGNEVTQYRALVHLLEKSIACTERKSKEIGGTPLEKIIVVMNYAGYTKQGRISTIKGIIEILANHYPERLANVYLIDPPMVARVFWTIVRPFLDPVTKEKFVFCIGEAGIQQFTTHVKDVDKLEPSIGGTGDVRPFDTQEYLHLPQDVCFDE